MTNLIDPYDLSDPSDYPAAMKRDADRIRELQKRNGELEAERDRWKATAEEEAEIGNERLRDLTAERQRREEVEADRDQFRAYAHEITKALTGLVGGGSEMFSGRIRTGTDREMFKADLPFCVDRIRRRFDATHEAIKGEARERKRRENAEAALKRARDKLHKAIIVSGSSEEAADACCEEYDAVLSSSGNEPGDGRSE